MNMTVSGIIKQQLMKQHYHNDQGQYIVPDIIETLAFKY